LPVFCQLAQAPLNIRRREREWVYAENKFVKENGNTANDAIAAFVPTF
jgi:hypothetical protein